MFSDYEQILFFLGDLLKEAGLTDGIPPTGIVDSRSKALVLICRRLKIAGFRGVVRFPYALDIDARPLLLERTACRRSFVEGPSCGADKAFAVSITSAASLLILLRVMRLEGPDTLIAALARP